MHPIEQLRYVARASGADAGLLVQEAASALGVFINDPAGLVTGCRRLLTRQPSVGPLWWMSGRMAMSTEPRRTAREIIDEIDADRTARELAHALPDEATVLVVGWPSITVQALARRGDTEVLVLDVEGQGHAAVRRLDRAEVLAEAVDPAHVAGAVEMADVVLVEAGAMGDVAALVDVGNLPAVAVARIAATPVWLVVGVGRHLPEAYFTEIIDRVTDRDSPAFISPYEVVSLGLVDRVVTNDGVHLPAELGSSDAPLAPELLTRLG